MRLQAVEVNVPPPLPRGIEHYGYVRWLVGTFYDIQDHRIQSTNRLKGINRAIGLNEKQQGAATDWLHRNLERLEAQIKATVQSEIKNHPLWNGWLKQVKGIGPCIAGTVISHISGDHFTRLGTQQEIEAAQRVGWEIVERDLKGPDAENPQRKSGKGTFRVRRGIGAFDTISAFWTYCGVGLDKDGRPQRRRAGVRGNWSPAMKLAAWKAGTSFVRCGRGYRELYEQFKAGYLNREPWDVAIDSDKYHLRGRLLKKEAGPAKDGDILTDAMVERIARAGVDKVTVAYRPAHVEAMARRKVAKVFLGHAWTRWREMDGLATELPYVIDRLGHKTLIPVVEE